MQKSAGQIHIFYNMKNVNSESKIANAASKITNSASKITCFGIRFKECTIRNAPKQIYDT